MVQVTGDILNYIGPNRIIFKDAKETSGYHMHVFKMKANKVHDKWVEDKRQRVWVREMMDEETMGCTERRDERKSNTVVVCLSVLRRFPLPMRSIS